MLSVFTLEESQQWDEIVKSFNNYDVYYLSDYVRAFNIHGDGKPILVCYEKNKFRAMNVFMLRDIGQDPIFSGKINSDTYFDISTPYGYGGFIFEGLQLQNSLIELEETFRGYCKENNIVSEFVRFHPIINNGDSLKKIYDVTDIGQTITLNLKSRDQIWNELKGKNRNVIRKAKKAGIDIYWGRNPELIDKFVEMYNATMDKDNASDYYYFNSEFYKSILNDLKYHFMIFYAVLDTNIVAMSMILFSNRNMHYHLSASDPKYLSYAPTNLLLYDAACWGYENGLEFFHLGGGLGGKEDSLFKFKKAFNKNSTTIFKVGKKIFDIDKYEELIQIRKGTIDNLNYFPLYRG
ncbi:GNAT family N-acetyltransferase [Bacillus sp. Marseille-Q3570]|uniref:GNAT family N-acetyltransferase n=1 Tax=Bacillus sp. Marseille-Q3570 TaxID=2963522 RepID=UPI0021B7E4BD|nr:GNAT family N-acetyltransferase [Bacillus sp. Marseille-Q3570]